MSRILVFIGDGKGKTTAALGMVLRAVGHKQNVAICQFLKSRKDVGELVGLCYLPNVRILTAGAGFVPKANSESYTKHVRSARRAMRWAKVSLRSPHIQLVILDEVCGAIAKGLIPVQGLLDELQNIVPVKYVVCTGRNCPPELIAIADTCTEMKKIKHALDHGIPAMNGVEK